MARKKTKTQNTRSKAAPSSSKSNSKGDIRPNLIQKEVACVLLVSFACFLFFAIGSHTKWLDGVSAAGLPWIQSLFDSLRTENVNMMGPVGARLATALFQFFGIAVVLLPLYLFIYSGTIWVEEKKASGASPFYSWANRLLLWFAILACCAGIVTAISANELESAETLGGEVGSIFGGGLSGAFGTSGAVLILGTGLLLLTYFLVRNYLGAIASSVTKLLAGAVKALMILSLWFSKLGGKALSMLCLNLPKAFWRSYREYRERRAEQRAQELEVLRLALKNDSSRNRRRDERPAPQPEPFRESRIVVVDHSKPLESLSQAQTEPREIEPREKFEDFIFPSTELLQPAKQSSRKVGEEELLACSAVIQEKLLDFNIPGQITHVHPGPVITMYEFEPAAGIKLGKITALQDDLAMALKAQSVRIIAPLPERGSVGIEVPNEDHQMVMLRELLEYDSNPGETLRLPIPLGKDTFGAPVTAYIADMPHLLLAGATGTGKSVCINAVLMSLLYKLHPSELQMILIDPKILELSVYEGIPHLKVPVVTDPRKAKAVLQWAVQEMDHRYRTLKKYGVRNIDAYNDLVSGKTPPDQVSGKGDEHRIIIEELEPLPKILIVIDELADLMLTSGREVEELITRLAQKARAAGIHLLLATQRPSVDVITGLIKANFPARVSFRVSSRIDSRTILDTMGAERLLGKGDMLFLRPGAHHLKRVHGAFVSDQEVRKVTSFLRESCKPEYDGEIMEMCEKALEDSGSSLEPGEADTSDPLYDKAVQFVLERGQASTSMIQRTFRIGYNRAARIVDTMEQEGLVGPMDGAKPRAVIVPHASGGE